MALLIGSLLFVHPSPASAQTETPEIPTYIVQPGDTLEDIAYKFGTSVLAILRENDIPNPNFLTVGMTLIIPGVEGFSGSILTTSVPIGYTLSSFAAQFELDPLRLANLNNITSPAQIYPGSSLILPETDPEMLFQLSQFQTNTTLLELSASNNYSWWDILLGNPYLSVPMGIPGDIIASSRIDDTQNIIPIPSILSIDIKPLPLVQGQTTVIQISTSQPVELSGSIAGNSLAFMPDGTNKYLALQGIHAMAPVGLSDFKITITTPDQSSTIFEQPVLLVPGKFRSDQRLIVDPATIEKSNTEPEDILVRDVISIVSDKKEWTNIFNEPIDVPPGVYMDPSCVTDRFGNRRAYNDGDFDYFHTGVDLTTCGNTLNIYAIAPGKVVMADSLVVRGNFTLIDHGWGVFSGYGHQAEMFVKVGDYVQAGQLIGFVGQTGRVTGPHLHLEVWVHGVQVNPIDWLDKEYP